MAVQNTINIKRPFWLNDYYIEPEKGLITRADELSERGIIPPSDQAVLVEPKVMQVLLFLITHHTKLVSQEDIFNAIWPRSIYSPSSIQRCIAILRKTLGDDAKTQSVIKTHPKRGYSLVANVYQPDCNTHNVNGKVEVGDVLSYTQQATPLTRQPITSYWKSITVIFLLVVSLYFVGKAYWQVSPLPGFQQIALEVLSASEDDEFFPRYSTDLRYTAYIKESDDVSSLWLRDNQSKNHQLLYSSAFPILSFAWLGNNQSLIFTELDYVDDNAHFFIKRLRINDSSVDVQLLHTLTGFIYLADIYIADDHMMYALVQSADSYNMRVLQFDLVTGQETLLSTIEQTVTLRDMALSQDGHHLALVAEDTRSHQQKVFEYDIEKKKPTHRITLSASLIRVSWHPDGKTLLLSDTQQMHILDSENQLSHVNYTSFSQIQDANFAGPDQIVFSLVTRDADIISYPLDTTKPALSPLDVVNSTQIDHSARLSPLGKQVAFVSQRQNARQLFVTSESKERVLLSSNSGSEPLSAPLWQSETSLFVVIGEKLKRIDTLSGHTEDFHIEANITHLLSWHQDSQTLLATFKQNDNLWIGRFSPQTQRLSNIFPIKPEQAAHAIGNKDIVVIQHNKFFLVNTEGSLELLWDTGADNIDMSVNSGSGMFFQVRNADEHQLWQYDLLTKSATQIMTIPSNQLLIDVSQDESTALFRRLEKEMDIAAIQQITRQQ